MKHTLEEVLNLPESKRIIERSNTPVVEEPPMELNQMFDQLAEYDRITAALPHVKGLGDASDRELDELAILATETFKDLRDLGMNMEARYSGRIFEVASQMLKNAIDAKTAKMEKKLKMVDLQLKKYKIDTEANKKKTTDDEPIAGEGFVVSDRNSLLEKLRNLQ